MTTTTSWSPIVYGRTLHADRWWRALPDEISIQHWAAEAVLATVAGGTRLVHPADVLANPPPQTPRFVLARGLDGIMVGAACQARMLSDDMCRDEHGRILYCFVGWFSSDPVPYDIPSLADLKANLASWAGPVYEEQMRPVWDLHAAQVNLRQSTAGPAPWDPPDGITPAETVTTSQGPLDTSQGSPDVGFRETRIYPDTMAEELWARGTCTTTRFTLVCGWQYGRDALLERISHLSAEDVIDPRIVEHEPPPAKPPQDPATEQPLLPPTDPRFPDAQQPYLAPSGGEEFDRLMIEVGGNVIVIRVRGYFWRALDFLHAAGTCARSVLRPDHPAERHEDPAGREMGGDAREARRRSDQARSRRGQAGRPVEDTEVSPAPSGQDEAPIETELPRKQGTKKYFEGLD